MTTPNLAKDWLAFTVRTDIDETEIKTGDSIYTERKPGWGKPGLYMLSYAGETLAVFHVDPLTKKGRPRKWLHTIGMRLATADPELEAHRVTCWQHTL